MTGSRRAGILGGMFDPIHNGHLDVLAAAQAALELNEMRVLPSNIPPHRPPAAASSYHRFAMVALAVAGRPGWQALDLDLRADAPSYTSDTLRWFHAQGFGVAELFFITGADAFLEIATWKDYPALLDLAHFVVVSRRGASVGDLSGRLPALAPRMRMIGAAPANAPSIFLIDTPTADVSSTAIRHKLRRHESIAGMVPPPVQQHIEQHALYKDPIPVAEAGSRPADQAAGRLHGRP